MKKEKDFSGTKLTDPDSAPSMGPLAPLVRMTVVVVSRKGAKVQGLSPVNHPLRLRAFARDYK
jgi:hypothetical protein